MNEFKRYHPVSEFVYFIFAIVFSCVFLHPVMLAISVGAAIVCKAMLKSAGQIKKILIFMIPLIILSVSLNTLFSNNGATVIAYLPWKIKITLESVCYGAVSSFMIMSLILFFSCFNEVITSDKIIYLSGRMLPSLSLVFLMTLRFVPEFTRQFREVMNARKCVGRDMTNGNIIRKVKNGLSVLSVMVTRSLENAIDTSDSMKSRGYGTGKRSRFSIYKFGKRDAVFLAVTVLCAGYVIAGGVMGKLRFECFPEIEMSGFSPYGISVFVSYFIMMFLPVIIEIAEVIKWKYTK